MLRVYGSVNRSALLHNLSIVRQLAPTARLMAVVKKDAYGHGLIQVAKTLQPKVEGFAVASLEEAISLRNADIEKPILVLSGFFATDQITYFQQYRIQPVIYCDEQLAMLTADQHNQLTIWIKLDTGMNRLGFPIEKCATTIKTVQNMPALRLAGLMTHFACADDLKCDMTHWQIERFNQVTARWKGSVSLANSAAVLRWPASRRGWLRPGIMLYGASPFAAISAEQLGLKPVMDLYSRIISIKTVPAGTGIGYGQTWVSSTKTRVGLVAIGYGDGYHRYASNRANVLINHHRVNVIGRTSMDSMAVDLRNVPNVAVGTPVKLLGQGLPVEKLAVAAGTIPYEIFTSLNSRTISLTYE